MIPGIDLVSITLCNIVGYKGKHVFNFSPGLTGVIGENGSGKSTILNFIPFLLWGETSEKISAFLNTDVFPDSTGKEECYASLDFKAGHLHRITRSVDSRGKSMSHKLEIFSDEFSGNLYSKSEKEISKYILGLSKITHDMAACSIISFQGKTDNFFTLSNPDQKEMIDSFLQAQYEQRQARLKQRAGYFSALLSRVDRFAIGIKRRRDEYNTSITSVKAHLSKLNESIAAVDLLGIDAKLIDLKARRDEVSSLIANSETMTKALATSKQQIKLLEDKITTEEAKITSLESDINKKEAQLSQVIGSVKSVKASAKGLKKISKPSGNEITGAKEQLKYYTAMFNNYVTETTSAQNLITVMDEALQALQEQGKKLKSSVETGICHACNRPGADTAHIETELKALRQEYSTRSKERQDKVAAFEADLIKRQEFKGLKEEWDIKLSEAEKAADAYSQSEKARTTAASNLRGQRRSYVTIRNDLTTLKASLVVLSEQVATTTKDTKLSIEELHKEVLDLESKVTASTTYTQKLQECDTEIAELEKARETVVDAKAQVRVYTTSLEDLSESLSKVEGRLLEAQITHEKLTLRNSEYTFMKKMFDSGYEKYFSHALDIISSETNELLKEINSPLSVQVSCISKGKGSSVTTVVKKRGKPISYTLASGGQRVVLGMCFRMALWRFINVSVRSPLSFFILDEVFGQLDPSNSSYVFNQIVKLKKYFKYVILTSHTDHVWNTDNKIMVT